MSEPAGPGSLKLVTAASPARELSAIVEHELAARAGANDVRHLHSNVFLIHTESDAATIRDWLAPHLREGETLLVAEFERWSAHGATIDQAWLLRRGH